MSTRALMPVLFVLALLLTATACKAECDEKCNKDDDCIAGHACFQFANNDKKVCAPVACKGCQDICSYQINSNADAVQGCIFVSCDDTRFASFDEPTLASY